MRCYTKVCYYEILAGMWVRNGHQIRGQGMTYIQSHFCKSTVDVDVYLLQVTSVYCHLLNVLHARVSLVFFCCGWLYCGWLFSIGACSVSLYCFTYFLSILYHNVFGLHCPVMDLASWCVLQNCCASASGILNVTTIFFSHFLTSYLYL